MRQRPTSGCFLSSKLWKIRRQARRVRRKAGRFGMRVVKLCEGSPPSGGAARDVIATPRAAQAALQRTLHHGFSVQARQLVFGAGGGLPDPFQHKQQWGALSSRACLPGIQARKSDELSSLARTRVALGDRLRSRNCSRGRTCRTYSRHPCRRGQSGTAGPCCTRHLQGNQRHWAAQCRGNADRG